MLVLFLSLKKKKKKIRGEKEAVSEFFSYNKENSSKALPPPRKKIKKVEK